MTLLCVAIFVTDPAAAKRDIALAGEAGADMVELRVDHLTDPAIVQQLVRDSSLPCIVTCRPTWEGGNCELPEEERLQLLAAAAAADPAYIDIELKSARGRAGAGGNSKLIVSTHDFSGRPDRLYNLIADLNASGGDINKVVWMARSIRDNLEAFEILKTRQKPTIALCMGEAGLISRVLARKFGGFLTFAALDSSGGTASGQIAVADMKKLYRWDSIGPATKVYGVVGSPVMHSMSPAIHNAAFDAVGHDGVYVPLLVEPGYESFKAFMETFLDFDGLHLSGLSVTIPHKENCLRYLKEKGAQIEPLAESIGAVNTVVVERNGGKSDEATKRRSDEGKGTKDSALSTQDSSSLPTAYRLLPTLRGFNTDYAAILDSITSALGISREELAGRRVAVIGAGGTGRTAVAGLAHYGASVVVYNRTLDRASALAAEFNGRRGHVEAAPLEALRTMQCEILINTTSVGMHPKVGDSPLGDDPACLSPGMLVFDTVYNPMRTRLLSQAMQAGAKTVSGVEMFVRQAVGQFEAWTGRPAPRDIMRQIIERRLAPRVTQAD